MTANNEKVSGKYSDLVDQTLKNNLQCQMSNTRLQKTAYHISQMNPKSPSRNSFGIKVPRRWTEPRYIRSAQPQIRTQQPSTNDFNPLSRWIAETAVEQPYHNIACVKQLDSGAGKWGSDARSEAQATSGSSDPTITEFWKNERFKTSSTQVLVAILILCRVCQKNIILRNCWISQLNRQCYILFLLSFPFGQLVIHVFWRVNGVTVGFG